MSLGISDARFSNGEACRVITDGVVRAQVAIPRIVSAWMRPGLDKECVLRRGSVASACWQRTRHDAYAIVVEPILFQRWLPGHSGPFLAPLDLRRPLDSTSSQWFKCRRPPVCASRNETDVGEAQSGSQAASVLRLHSVLRERRARFGSFWFYASARHSDRKWSHARCQMLSRRRRRCCYWCEGVRRRTRGAGRAPAATGCSVRGGIRALSSRRHEGNENGVAVKRKRTW